MFLGIKRTYKEGFLSKLKEQVTRKDSVPRLTKFEVSVIPRLPMQRENMPDLIVRFACNGTRYTLLESGRNLKGTDVYIRGHMIKHCRVVLAATKDFTKRKSYM